MNISETFPFCELPDTRAWKDELDEKIKLFERHQHDLKDCRIDEKVEEFKALCQEYDDLEFLLAKWTIGHWILLEVRTA